ncbi:MAG: hypothetical protein PUP93_24410 [Rhizonema sp. NSF051]|nr:hypothetical protein [Rhizonema sp. NSF051]
MAANQKSEKPLYSMMVNGSSYLFIKTLGKQYAVSDLFATRRRVRGLLSDIALL